MSARSRTKPRLADGVEDVLRRWARRSSIGGVLADVMPDGWVADRLIKAQK